MSYTVLAVLGLVGTAVVDLLLLRTRLLTRRVFWTAYAILAVFQLAVNGIFTGVPIVRYNPAAIIGWRLIYAPVEDLAFGFAMILLTLSTWVWLGRRAPTPAQPPVFEPVATPPPGR